MTSGCSPNFSEWQIKISLIADSWVYDLKKKKLYSYNISIPADANLSVCMPLLTSRKTNKQTYITLWFMHARGPKHKRLTLCTAHAHSTIFTSCKYAAHSDKGHFHVVTSQRGSRVVCRLTFLLLCAKSPTQSARNVDLGSNGESVLLTCWPLFWLSN